MVSDNDVKQCLHDIIDFFDLVDLADLKERIGTNVLLVREPVHSLYQLIVINGSTRVRG